jgi:hypothetical protein
MKIIPKRSITGRYYIVMFACNTKKEEPAVVVVDREQIKKEIQAKEDEFVAIYNSGELKSILLCR